MVTKQACQFDAAGLYAGTADADESPLEPGVFLLPGRSTFVEPPATWPDGKWPRWNGLEWVLVNRAAEAKAEQESPIEKLRAFLDANPEVADLLSAPA